VHGVHGVEGSNPSVPTNKIKDLQFLGCESFFIFRHLVRSLVRKNLNHYT
jgi:hypothetical protein